MNQPVEQKIIVENLHKSFGDVKALRGVDLDVQTGQVFALLGPNGAGKTTLVHILTTLLKPDRGHATVSGLDVTTEQARLREIIGLSGQFSAVDENLTGRENLVMVGQLYHLPRDDSKKRADNLLDRFGLDKASDRVVKTYSGGMRRRLDLAASLLGQPQVLFLDEPTTGLDPRSRQDMWGLIRELVDRGTTILLTTQYLDEADELADRIAVIDEGRIIAEGTTEELKSRVGNDVLELKITEDAQLGTAVELLRPIAVEAPQTNDITDTITLPVTDGTHSLVEAVRDLDQAGIELIDMHLRRPSLDDVFLALTGETSQEKAEAEPVPAEGD